MTFHHHTKYAKPTRHRGRQASAFTLIELLVVIAIISLLVSILLPSLQKAKEFAQAAACLAHLRGTSVGMQIYCNEHDGYLAGPNTSGLISSSTSMTAKTDPCMPTQNVDWFSPTIGETLKLPRERGERILAALNSDLLCPANKENYDSQYGSPTLTDDPTQIRYVSYSAALAFHVYSYERANLSSLNNDDRNLRNYGGAKIPTNYAPIIEKVGPPSQKVYTMDGARYVDRSSGEKTFNAYYWQWQGGNMMLYGPTSPLYGDPFENIDRFGYLAYRHPGETMNASFFDGHCEAMTVEESLDNSKYLPTGSVITSAGTTEDPDDHTGDVIR